jgi:hypothetical protein
VRQEGNLNAHNYDSNQKKTTERAANTKKDTTSSVGGWSRSKVKINFAWSLKVNKLCLHLSISFNELFFSEKFVQISGIITPWETFTLTMRVLGAFFPHSPYFPILSPQQIIFSATWKAPQHYYFCAFLIAPRVARVCPVQCVFVEDKAK